MGLRVPVLAQCWSWTPRGITETMVFDSTSLIWTAFDESRGQPALLIRNTLNTYPLQLWHYDGLKWMISWDGIVTPPSGHFVEPVGLYFDRRQNSLIMIAYITYDFEIVALDAFRFDQNHGWLFIAEAESCGRTQDDILPIYDSRRERAVLILPNCGGADYFLEFDGYQFYNIYIDRSVYDFKHGVAGYNPDTGHIVFFGNNQKSNPQQAETYEYDGCTWIEVETSDKPSETSDFVSGLIYSAELNAMIIVSLDYINGSEVKTWMYKDREWKMLPCGSNPDLWYNSKMAWDPRNDRAYLICGYVHDGKISMLTWKLEKRSHCRPVSKP